MSLLKLIDHYNNKVDGTITSFNQVETMDTGTDQTFTLAATSIVLAIYTTTNDYGATQILLGRYSQLRVDDDVVAQGVDSPYDSDYACRTYAIWCGELAAGEHTIEGSIFHSWSDEIVSATSRQLTILVFSGTEFDAINSEMTDASTDSSTLVDDTTAAITITPSADCYALVLYTASNHHEHVESAQGKYLGIKIGATDYAEIGKSPCYEGMQDSTLTHKVLELTGSTEYTIKGRFRRALDGTVYIDERSLIVLLIDKEALLNTDSDDYNNQANTDYNTLQDDTDITITRTLADTRVLFAIASCVKDVGTLSSSSGQSYALNIDASDKFRVRSSGCNYSTVDSATICEVIELTAGEHTVKGRFSNNATSQGDTAKYDERYLTCLWFALPASNKPSAHLNGLFNKFGAQLI